MSQATLGSTIYRNSNLFSSYYLDERVDDLDAWDCNEDAEAAFEELQHLWELEGDLVASYKEDELLTSWIDDVLDILGFGTLAETTLPDKEGYNDRLLFESDEVRRDASLRKRDGEVDAMYGLASAVLEAKQWGADFTKRFSETRSYRDASHQIKYYLEHTPEQLQWGILTDGKTWRLYGTKDYATETFYEVNLPELLESENLEKFKYFYLFFRPEAFQEVSGTSFLETVWNESETAAQELGEDLQDNVFTALRVLGEGFIETNDLSIDPTDAAAREELKEQSLVLLYRLMFVLYAESRHLISPDEPRKRTEFKENFSLDEIRQEIHDDITSGGSFEDYSEYSTSMWGRLEDLFRLIDRGEKSLGIPPYNGGLFDSDTHEFLAKNEVSDRYIAEVVYRLGTTLADDGAGFVLADYADLDTRHLGTIYEGLLEHEFRIAPEQYAAVAEDGGQVWKSATEVSVADAVETVETGELYVVNDDGERKATGAYYTPDYVVTYIVEETIDPLLEDIDEELRAEGLKPSDRKYFAQFWQSVLDLKVLDPAMGSGHFLTKATGYLTEQVMEVVREQEIQSYDEQDLRRQIAKECIYGVDVNGMAVELAKLSMWLETLATDKPLAFLDHHLKAGNSLVGSDITEVLSDDVEEEGGQLTLMQAAARVRRRTLEHVMELMQDLLAIDNEKLEDIKSMEELYNKIRDDPLYGRLFELANVHTAERFGLDIPEGVYEKMADAIENSNKWNEIRKRDWFIAAQKTAEEENFFHWELEYPEVFFGTEGEMRFDAGFDALIGNPPYVRIQELNRSASTLVEYLLGTYDVVQGKFDLFVPFIAQGMELAGRNGISTFIIPNKFMKSSYGELLRNQLASEKKLKAILDFGDYQVFDDLLTYTCILSVSSRELESATFAQVESNWLQEIETNDVDYENLSESTWSTVVGTEADLLDTLLGDYPSLGELSKEIYQGIIVGGDDHFILKKVAESKNKVTVKRRDNGKEYRLEKEMVKPFSKGSDIRRYQFKNDNKVLVYPYRSSKEDSSLIIEHELQEKYPDTYSYLCEYRKALESRGSDTMEYPNWYSLWRPRSGWIFDIGKIVTPAIAKSGRFAYDESSMFFNGSGGGGGGAYGIILEETEYTGRAMSALLNSSVSDFVIRHISSQFQGGYYAYNQQYIKELPIPNADETSLANLADDLPADVVKNSDSVSNAFDYLVQRSEAARNAHEDLNLALIDHLGAYDDGPALADVGFTQPPKNAAESILQQTTEQRPNLRVGRAEVYRESNSTVEVRLTARYKPNDDVHETDQWGYTETEAQPALRITDLSSAEANLIEAFVPLAVEEAGGFAGFRETATKTNSLIDRLRRLTLPRLADVRDGLESYTETKARAEELESKIERTDDLIDDIVYELYGLTDEEIEIVEEAVGE